MEANDKNKVTLYLPHDVEERLEREWMRQRRETGDKISKSDVAAGAMLRGITSAVVVRETTDYDRFELMSWNRDASHARNIEHSIDRVGSYLDHFPIIVVQLDSGELGIYDGQGRYLAAKSKGLPVYYIVSDRLHKDHVAHLNSGVANWKTRDYLEYYVDQGYEDYQAAGDFQQEHPFMSLNFIRDYGQGGDNGTTQDDWKAGSWCFEREDLLRKVAQYALAIKPYFAGWKHTIFHRVLRHLALMEDYDHEWFVSRLEVGQVMHKRVNMEDYFQQMEEIYHYRARGGKSEIRFGSDL